MVGASGSGCYAMQFDTDLVTLRQQSAPFYLRWQFWWTTVPILLTLVLAATAIALRVTSPNAVGLRLVQLTLSSGGQLLIASVLAGQILAPCMFCFHLVCCNV